MDLDLDIFALIQIFPKTHENIARFELRRLLYKKWLRELGEDAQRNHIAEWMRSVIAERTPELISVDDWKQEKDVAIYSGECHGPARD